MASSKECNVAWEKGYIDGYRSIKGNKTPPIPPRPTAGTNPKDYYQKGYSAGVSAAK